MSYTVLDRTLICIEGEDNASFLQGLITQDVYKLSSLGFSLMLTPQGRFSYDFFIVKKNDAFILDCDALCGQDLYKKLQLYKLRSRVRVSILPGQVIASKEPLTSFKTTHDCFQDPRSSYLGWRYYMWEEGGVLNIQMDTPWDFRFHTMTLGLPQGVYDLNDKSIPLECYPESIQAISFEKGCYMGQELTARTKHTGLVRKRLFPGYILNAHAVQGAEIMCADKVIGKVQSVYKNLFLARLHTNDFYGAYRQNHRFYCNDVQVHLWCPVI